MPYEFDMPIIRGLLNRKQEEDEAKNTLNQLMTPQPPVEQPTPTEIPEQRGGKDMVNAAVENALRPAPNPYEVNLQRLITAQKQAYGTAQNDSARQAASSKAELLRGIANSAGLDMNGYGSDVSLEDSYRNLASREAQDIVEALQGQYAMSSDRYYERQYARALAQGLSLESAKRVAGAQAREYQANRVAYLQGVYNSYGRDGRVTNDYGNQFLAMMAQENPSLANFYTQVYPNQRDAYARDNQLEDKVLAQRDLLERLGITNDLSKDYAAYASELKKNEKFFDSNVDLQTRRAEKDDDFADLKRLTEYKQALEAQDTSQIRKWVMEGKELAGLSGLTGADADAFAARYAIAQATKDLDKRKPSEKNKSSSEPKLTESQQKAFNQSENLFDNAHSNHSDEDIAAFEEFVNEHGTEFNAAYYQKLKDMILALKGYQRKLKNDDDGATSYWSQVRDVNVLEAMYPNENWDYYWKQRGGKRK